MPTEPAAGAEVRPAAQEFSIEAGDITGKVIAMQFIGTAMNYLVLDSETEKPVWIREGEISRAYG